MILTNNLFQEIYRHHFFPKPMLVLSDIKFASDALFPQISLDWKTEFRRRYPFLDVWGWDARSMCAQLINNISLWYLLQNTFSSWAMQKAFCICDKSQRMFDFHLTDICIFCSSGKTVSFLVTDLCWFLQILEMKLNNGQDWNKRKINTRHITPSNQYFNTSQECAQMVGWPLQIEWLRFRRWLCESWLIGAM